MNIYRQDSSIEQEDVGGIIYTRAACVKATVYISHLISLTKVLMTKIVNV